MSSKVYSISGDSLDFMKAYINHYGSIRGINDEKGRYFRDNIYKLNNKLMKSKRSSGAPSGSKLRWRGRNKKGNIVLLMSKKGYSKIKSVSYKTKFGPRRLVITHRVIGR